jgi:hypothetical protein
MTTAGSAPYDAEKFSPLNSLMLGVLAPALAWRGPHAALAAGASFSHRAQGGGIWPGGAGMPGHQPQALANQAGT